MPLIAPTGYEAKAAALVRTGLLDDPDAGVLIITQNSDYQALLIAVTALTVRTLLAANGYDVAAALAVIDQWLANAARPPVPS